MEASIARIARRDGAKRIVVYECCPAGDVSVAALLEGEGRCVDSCEDAEALLDSVCTHRPDAIVAVLRRECRSDFGVLHLVRRTAPSVPIIFVATDTTLQVESVARDLQPLYYAVAPIDPDEIWAAVESALGRGGSRPKK
jgi:DNA-binding response OmpR family regulator